uniref:Uncharacterized protein n=1 Tax=Amphimedon queenslandica TaxID=400682 RepID=A0A1X7TZK2_AMPQE
MPSKTSCKFGQASSPSTGSLCVVISKDGSVHVTGTLLQL